MSPKPTEWPPLATTVHGVLAAASKIVDYNGWSGREGREVFPRWATPKLRCNALTDVIGAIQMAATGSPVLSNEVARAAVEAFETFVGGNADMWNDEEGRTAREVIDELAAVAEHEREDAEERRAALPAWTAVA